MLSLRLYAVCFITLFVSFFAEGEPTADLVIVKKSARIMTTLKNGKILNTYHIAMGGNPKHHKVKEGDERTPEGRYILDYKKSDSAFYRAIHISYPNDADLLAAKAKGVNPGGYIMIHGQEVDSKLNQKERQKYNWTDGCIAITNLEMDQLWRTIEPGTPIEIWP